MPGRSRSAVVIVLTSLFVLLLGANPALAYIGPGTGLEFVGYFLALLATVGVALFSVLLYPVYAVIRFFRGPKQAPPSTAVAAAPPVEPAPADVPAPPATDNTAATPN